jgi:hypothetical protein
VEADVPLSTLFVCEARKARQIYLDP